MSRARLLRILALLVCVIALMQSAAIVFSLYWTLWWYDILLHFLGGIFIGLLVLWVRFLSGYFPAPSFPWSHGHLFLFTLFWTLIIGVGWEVFEWLVGNTWSMERYWLDTTLDVALDLIGSIVASFYFTRQYLGHD